MNPSADYSQLNVMVLDDDPAALMLLELFCKKLGVRNLVVMDHSPEAVRYIRNNRDTIDVILSDVQMPECDGFELCQHLQHL